MRRRKRQNKYLGAFLLCHTYMHVQRAEMSIILHGFIGIYSNLLPVLCIVLSNTERVKFAKMPEEYFF